MEFLLIILICLVIIPCLYLGYKIWRVYRAWNRFRNDPIGFFMDQAQRTAQEQAKARAGSSGNKDPRRPARRKKKISADLGEYVEFTEISSYTQTVYTDTKGSFRVEEQIQDIKWEDIK